ncbi:hypothetical protein KSB_93120 [Ktedonobacter robiniae]|uniref:Uncharacterized protein n=1 Tax=Ktedonobacter robiniae TaxID=2778365 RepID=A0ABQ3V8H0_9CHLR|nr:hypothetical protein KSB_93120 [Ktedonobacter robiniae]
MGNPRNSVLEVPGLRSLLGHQLPVYPIVIRHIEVLWGRGGGGIAGVEVFLDAVLKGLQRIGWLILLVGVGDDGEGVFGEVAKEEVVGEVVKGMLFFLFSETNMRGHRERRGNGRARR